MSLYDEMPKRSAQQESGDLAEAEVHAWIRRHRHLYRPLGRTDDFGIDGELELADATVSGLLVKVQVKALQRVEFNADGVCVVSVKQSTINYWTLIRLPVVAVLWCHETRRAFWAIPPSGLVPDAVELRFKRDDEATGNEAAFFEQLRSLALRPADVESIDRLPFIIASVGQVVSIGHLDPGTRLDVAANGLIALAYETVRQVRHLLGLAPKLLPWSLWLRRDRRITALGYPYEREDIVGLLDVVAGEIYLHLRPAVLSMLGQLQNLAGEGKLGDFPAVEQFLRDDLRLIRLPPRMWDDTPPSDVEPSWSGDPDIDFDRILRSLNVRLFPLEHDT